MKIRLLYIGQLKTEYIKAGVQDYRERLERFLTVNEQAVKPKKRGGDPNVMRQSESEALLDKITDDDYVILLEEQGRSMSSRQWARFLNEQLQYQTKQLTFVIGGSYGVNKTMRQRADLRWRLSKLTFPHELAQLILMEQLYRALTIIKGQPYHH